MPGLAVIRSEEYLKHRSSSHPECPERLEAIWKGLKKVRGWEAFKPEPADLEAIGLVHSRGYTEHIREYSRMEMPLDLDTYACKDTFEVARLAVGGTLKACDLVAFGGFRYAFAAVRPPGHHASSDRARGFCIFNNVAIGARYLAKKGKRVAILDVDGHHGNGTQDILYREPILYCSLHQWKIFPGTGHRGETGAGKGKGLTINVPLDAGTRDKEYLDRLDGVLEKIEEYKPDILLVSLGFDAHERDPLTGLRLTTGCYGEIAKRIKRWPLVLVLEGGYDLQALEESTEEVVKELV